MLQHLDEWHIEISAEEQVAIESSGGNLLRCAIGREYLGLLAESPPVRPWREEVSDLVAACESWLAENPDADTSEPLSEAWFFSKARRLGAALLDEPDPEMRVEIALRLGLFNAQHESIYSKDYVRLGVANKRATAKAGANKKGKIKSTTQAVFEEMRRLMATGRHSVWSAAGQAAAKGVGKSQDANNKLWHRHNPK